MSTPVPSSKPALTAEPRRDVDVPVEALRLAARRGPHPEVEVRRAAHVLGQQPHRRRQHRRPRRVLGEAGRLGAGHDPQLVGRPRGPGADQRRLVVDRHQPLPPPHLLDQDVAEQPASRRPFAVGAGPLALPRDRERHEGQRVELGVGVLERGARGAALVDDQLHVGGIGVGAHPLAPGLHGGGDLLVGELRQRRRVLGRVDDDLVRPGRRPRGEEVRFARPPRGQQRVAAAGEGAGLRRRSRLGSRVAPQGRDRGSARPS